MKYDAIVIGGGPGGYTTAVEIGKLGGKALLVEKATVGGCCVNEGCIPTKAMYASAELLRRLRRSQKIGVSAKPKFDFKQAMEHRRRAVEVSVKGVQMLLDGAGVEVVRGEAVVAGKGIIKVNGKKYEGRSLVVATGSEPREIPRFKADGKKILSSEHVLELKNIPESMLVIGGGAIGVEYASIFNEYGTKVTIVELTSQLLPGFDPEVAVYLKKSMERNGVKIKLETRIGSGDELVKSSEKVLVCVGRKPVYPKGVDKLGLDYGETGIHADLRMRAGSNVYAVGDVIRGKPMLAHKAYMEGRIAARNIMGRTGQMSYRAVPNVVFSFPEVATVGIITTHEEGKSPFISNGKARVMGETEGFVKVYLDSEDLAGVYVVGAGASEMVEEAALAIENNLTVEQILGTIHAHPTLAEAFYEAVEDAIRKR